MSLFSTTFVARSMGTLLPYSCQSRCVFVRSLALVKNMQPAARRCLIHLILCIVYTVLINYKNAFLNNADKFSIMSDNLQVFLIFKWHQSSDKYCLDQLFDRSFISPPIIFQNYFTLKKKKIIPFKIRRINCN